MSKPPEGRKGVCARLKQKLLGRTAVQLQQANLPKASRPSFVVTTSSPAVDSAVAVSPNGISGQSHGNASDNRAAASLADLTDLRRQPPPEDEAIATKGPIDANDSVGPDQQMARLSKKVAPVSPAHREAELEVDATHRIDIKASWASNRTPLWNEAIAKWTATPEGKKKCAELEKLLQDTPGGVIENPEFLGQLQPKVGKSDKWRLRFKRYEAIFNATRGIAITLANNDPHKLAPIVVHSVFAGTNILFNRMSPENTEKVLDILFGCSDTIRECVSFEKNFLQKEHPRVQEEMASIRKSLPDVYLRALSLIHDVHTSCSHVKREHASKMDAVIDWVKTTGIKIWNEFIDKIVVWEAEEKSLKREVGRWSRTKKSMDEALKADKDICEVRHWLRSRTDDEPTLEEIMFRVMPDNMYGNAAEWFLVSDEFCTWCGTFSSSEVERSTYSMLGHNGTSTDNMEIERSSQEDARRSQALDRKRVLWIRGGYGTGKTTLFYHTHSALVSNPSYQLMGSELRVASYFCDSGKTGGGRPNYETILRALLYHISLSPDFEVAQPARTLHNVYHSSQAPGKEPVITEWEKIFKDIVAAGRDQYHYVFIVDALDECESLPQAERFLEFMSEVMRDNTHVSFLCSSHQHVRVWRYFGKNNNYYCRDVLEELEISESATAKDMEAFIDGELERRKKAASESAFYKKSNRDLLEQLKTTMKQHACGMFRWVQVWFDILLPPRSEDLPTLRSSAIQWLARLQDDVAEAKDAYQLLNSGYQRLWDFNKNADYGDDIRKRLFHIVMSVQIPLTLEMLTDALRIQGHIYDTELTTEAVQRMYANFLTEKRIYANLLADKRMPFISLNRREVSAAAALRFVHDSARTFVASVDQPQNEEFEADLTTVRMRQDQNHHRPIAEIYLNVIEKLDHPFWRASGFDFPAQAPFLSILDDHCRRLDSVMDIEMERSTKPFYGYLLRHGLYHVTRAAAKRSISDPMWTVFVNRVLCNATSGLAMSLALEPKQILHVTKVPGIAKARRFAGMLFGTVDGRLELLRPHTLVALNLIQVPDLEHLPFDIGADKSEVLRLFGNLNVHGASYGRIPSRGATALYLACTARNTAAVEAVLRAASCLYGQAAHEILHKGSKIPRRYYMAPFFEAVLNSDVATAKILLQFEVGSFGAKHAPRERLQCTVADQWNLAYAEDGMSLRVSAALLAAYRFSEAEFLELLSVASPKNITPTSPNTRMLLYKLATDKRMKSFELLASAIKKRYCDNESLKQGMPMTAHWEHFLSTSDNISLHGSTSNLEQLAIEIRKEEHPSVKVPYFASLVLRDEGVLLFHEAGFVTTSYFEC